MATASTASEHRKIDLQSPADLSHIHARLTASARDNIDRALPPAAAPRGEEDRLRRRVEELVARYVDALWDGVRGNVRVNGIDVVERGAGGAAAAAGVGGGEDGEGTSGAVGEGEFVVEEDLEPFDHALADRIRALEAQKETLTERVADLRRTAPQAAADNSRRQFELETEQWRRQAAEQRDAELERAGADDGAPALLLEADSLQRWKELARNWERGAAGLLELKGGLGETRAKVERAKKAVEYIEGR